MGDIERQYEVKSREFLVGETPTAGLVPRQQTKLDDLILKCLRSG